MPYSTAERAQVRFYLGWSSAFYGTSDALEQAMDNISQSRPDDLALAQDLLVKIDGHDAKVDPRLDASTWATKTGSIEQRSAYAHETMNKRGKIFVQRLARIHDVAALGDFFGTGQSPNISPRAGGAGHFELAQG